MTNRKKIKLIGGAKMTHATRIALRPCSIKDANAFIGEHHSHHRAVQGARFAIAAEIGGQLVGVVTVGNPVAAALNDGRTFEVTRLCCIRGERNVASRLLGAAWRASKAMGCRRIVSYLRADEQGTCYKAAGWRCVADVKGRGWNSGNKALRWLPGFYEPTTEIIDRTRWEKDAK